MENLSKFYIDGVWSQPNSGATMPVLNPATERQVGVVALGNAADVDAAVAAASRAFASYSQTTKAERLVFLGRLLKVTEARFEDLAQAMSMEMGAPISMARDAHADAAVGHLQGFIEALGQLQERESLTSGDIQLREPIGVCGLITPWNWPMNQIALKVIPSACDWLYLCFEAFRAHAYFCDDLCGDRPRSWLSGWRIQSGPRRWSHGRRRDVTPLRYPDDVVYGLDPGRYGSDTRCG